MILIFSVKEEKYMIKYLLEGIYKGEKQYEKCI